MIPFFTQSIKTLEDPFTKCIPLDVTCTKFRLQLQLGYISSIFSFEQDTKMINMINNFFIIQIYKK